MIVIPKLIPVQSVTYRSLIWTNQAPLSFFRAIKRFRIKRFGIERSGIESFRAPNGCIRGGPSISHFPNINPPDSDGTSAIVEEKNVSLLMYSLRRVNARCDCHAAFLHETLNDGVIHLNQHIQS